MFDLGTWALVLTFAVCFIVFGMFAILMFKPKHNSEWNDRQLLKVLLTWATLMALIWLYIFS